jgi:hypothetical protein
MVNFGLLIVNYLWKLIEIAINTSQPLLSWLFLFLWIENKENMKMVNFGLLIVNYL